MATTPTPTPPAGGGEEIEVEIRDVRIVPSFDPRRLGKNDALVTVMIGNRPLTVRVPEEYLDNVEKLAEEIKKIIQRERQYIGRKFKIRL